MAEQNIVAVYDTAAHAEAAVRALEQAGVPSNAISRHAQGGTSGATGTAAAPVQEKGFWSSLFGGADDDADVYSRSVAGGATVVTVRVPEQHVSRVSEILEAHDPVDLDERAASYGTASTATTTAATTTSTTAATATPAATTARTTAATGDDTIKVVAEQLHVGKRAVSRGGARIRSYVVETPVEEQVRLREENVTIERRPVNQPVGNVPADAFQEKVIEASATGEQAVVAKEARVVEEIGLRKEATERVETVRDTVRHTEVEVEDTTGTTRAAGTTTTGTTTTGTSTTGTGTATGTGVGAAVDRTLGTNISGTNPDRKS